MSDMTAALAAIVGTDSIRAATAEDSIDGVQPQLVVAPESGEQIAQILKYASEAGLRVVPRGGGSKLGWGNRPEAADLVIDMGRLDRVIEHAWGDMTATAQAGCRLATLQRTLGEHGQRLALDALWPERATIGGTLATNESGALRVRFGGLRDQILGVTVALPDGTLARAGGKVVKNVAGYDLAKLMTGALGTLGVIVEATFRLYPLPLATRELTLALPDAAAAQRATLAINDSTLVPAAAQIRAGAGALPQLDLRFEGLEAALDAQAQQLADMVGAQPQPCDPAAWRAREALWEGDGPALVCKLTLLPSDTAWACEEIGQVCDTLRLGWQLVLTTHGVGMLRLAGANDEVLLTALSRLRGDLAAREGSLSMLAGSPALKQRIEVWGDPGDALLLMRRVKERFDPLRILNPGRFVGRI